MKRLISVCVAATLGAAASFGGPTESAILAAMRLADQPNYSWVATISDDARTYDVAGKTSKGGFTRVKMPVINSVRRRLGRSVTDTQIDMIFRGNVACVIETDDGWKKPDELPPPEESEADAALMSPPTGHAPILGRHPSSGGVTTGSSIRLPRRNDNRDDDPRGYSNLQLAISHPHEELAVMVGSHEEFKVEGDTVSGTLSDLGAQLLLVRDGQKQITPLRATGTFKLWLRDGMVAKYQVNLHGILAVETANGRRQIEVRQSTDTVLKDIGTTTFEVPPMARAKLER